MSTSYFFYQVALLGLAVLLTQALAMSFRAGLFCLGQPGFFAVGAYGAVIVVELAGPAAASSSALAGGALFVASLLAAGFVGAGLGALTARALGRLSGDYFAVATLVLAEAIGTLFASWAFVGGGLGIEVPRLLFRSAVGERLPFLGFFAVLFALANALLFVGQRRLGASVGGLAIQALRDDELAAEFSGIPVRRLQRSAFTAASGVAGLAGGVFAHFAGLITPTDFSFVNGLPILLAVILARARVGRSVVAAVGIYVFYEALKLRLFGALGDGAGRWVDDGKEILFAAALIAAAVGPALLYRLGAEGRWLGREAK